MFDLPALIVLCLTLDSREMCWPLAAPCQKQAIFPQPGIAANQGCAGGNRPADFQSAGSGAIAVRGSRVIGCEKES